MAVELTIAQAKQHPASFMYVFADEQKFIKYLPAKYAKIIRQKKANQNKVLRLSADKYKSTYDAYTSAIREAFITTYGMTPAEALIKLAKGENVAGKNWSEGVFGIGAVNNTTFKGIEFDGKAVTVDPSTGHIMCGGQDITDTTKTVYKDISGNTKAFQFFAESSNGTITVMSQYNKLSKKYFAATYSVDGETYDASTNKQKSGSSSATVWENVVLNIENFLQWLLSLFGISTDSNVEMLSAENTLPNQTDDGFVTESGVGEAGAILLALAAGGALLAGTGKKKKGM